MNVQATNSSTEGPVLLEAINFTLRTLQSRTHMYRNLVVAVSLTGLASIAFALFLRRWSVLLGLLALPLYVTAFLYFDRKAVEAWRYRVVQMQSERGLNISQLCEILSGFRHLPQMTIASMLTLLTQASV